MSLKLRTCLLPFFVMVFSVLVNSTYAQTTGTATVTSLSPGSGTGGSVVTIQGTEFSGVYSVTFNGIAATTYTVNSATQITATVPADATTGNVVVTNSAGTSNGLSFTVLPSITNLTTFLLSSSGYVGTTVTITGTNFTGATAFTFDGTAATFTVNSSTQITTTVPDGASTGNVVVANADGASNGFPFTVLPFITRLSPFSGPVGTTITITGTRFTGATAVTFDGMAATFTVNSSTQITTTVPAGVTSDYLPVVVTTAGGTSNANHFMLYLPPTITSLSPGSAQVVRLLQYKEPGFLAGFQGSPLTA